MTQTKVSILSVYGLHTVQDRKELWHDLLGKSNSMTSPWLIMGDFNAILHIEDRVVGSTVQANEISDFAEFMQIVCMMKLKAVGLLKTHLQWGET